MMARQAKSEKSPNSKPACTQASIKIKPQIAQRKLTGGETEEKEH